MTTDELTALLTKYPQIKARVEAMLMFVDGTQEDIELADDAEDRVIADVRELGHTLMENWATRRSNHLSTHLKALLPTAKKHSKKKSVGKPPLE